ncbi:MAG: ZIP family metal transporter [Muribaculaceae bacterium]|nr:ZIP family metal transporter [Muribaculaceae bacterium]
MWSDSISNFGLIALGLAIPFAGTTAGAACVYLMRRQLPERLEKTLTGFAAGVMTAASVWSLLIPAMEQSGDSGFGRVLPAAVGFIVGVLFLLFLDKNTPHQHLHSSESEGPKARRMSPTTKLALAVTIHNVPEGIAVGIALAGAMVGESAMPVGAALALCLGISLQNFPEGAIVSMPMRALGHSRTRAFVLGTLSGAVEPVAAALTLLAASLILPYFPYMLAFGAGAMMYVVVEELLPMSSSGHHSDLGTIGFTAGFVLMMILDVVLA